MSMLALGVMILESPRGGTLVLKRCELQGWGGIAVDFFVLSSNNKHSHWFFVHCHLPVRMASSQEPSDLTRLVVGSQMGKKGIPSRN